MKPAFSIFPQLSVKMGNIYVSIFSVRSFTGEKRLVGSSKYPLYSASVIIPFHFTMQIFTFTLQGEEQVWQENLTLSYQLYWLYWIQMSDSDSEYFILFLTIAFMIIILAMLIVSCFDFPLQRKCSYLIQNIHFHYELKICFLLHRVTTF